MSACVTQTTEILCSTEGQTLFATPATRSRGLVGGGDPRDLMFAPAMNRLVLKAMVILGVTVRQPSPSAHNSRVNVCRDLATMREVTTGVSHHVLLRWAGWARGNPRLAHAHESWFQSHIPVHKVEAGPALGDAAGGVGHP